MSLANTARGGSLPARGPEGVTGRPIHPGTRPIVRPGVVPRPGAGATATPLALSRKEILAATMRRHGAVRPSIQLSDIPTVSTGTPDLDTLLGHGGLPLGSMLLVEESGNTDFAALLLRAAAAQGICHARLTTKNTPDSVYDTRVIVVGADGPTWGTGLPGEYRDKKQAKRDKIEKEKGLVGTDNSSMKIAWRYGRQAATPSEAGSSPITENNPHYHTVFDFTSRLVPGPVAGREIEYVGGGVYFAQPSTPGSFLDNLYIQIEAAVSRARTAVGPHGLIRLVVPALLHPATYPPEASDPAQLLRFLSRLKDLVGASSQVGNLVAFVSLALDLYPRETYLTSWTEQLFDGVIQLEPFPEKLGESDNSNNDESSGASKPYQGLVHVFRVPVLSARGGMHVRVGEHAFRVSRKRFEIDEWGIPVEDEEPEASSGDKTKKPGSSEAPSPVPSLDF